MWSWRSGLRELGDTMWTRPNATERQALDEHLIPSEARDLVSQSRRPWKGGKILRRFAPQDEVSVAPYAVSFHTSPHRLTIRRLFHRCRFFAVRRSRLPSPVSLLLSPFSFLPSPVSRLPSPHSLPSVQPHPSPSTFVM